MILIVFISDNVKGKAHGVAEGFKPDVSVNIINNKYIFPNMLKEN